MHFWVHSKHNGKVDGKFNLGLRRRENIKINYSRNLSMLRLDPTPTVLGLILLPMSTQMLIKMSGLGLVLVVLGVPMLTSKISFRGSHWQKMTPCLQ